MKNLLFIAALFLVACTSSAVSTKTLNLEQVRTAISKQPVKNPVVFDENTDPNKLLGRPNGYIEKMNFTDSRIEGSQNNCSIEVYPDADSAKRRKNYIETIGKGVPVFTEYIFQNNNALLRIDKALTPEQADEYKKIFESL